MIHSGHYDDDDDGVGCYLKIRVTHRRTTDDLRSQCALAAAKLLKKPDQCRGVLQVLLCVCQGEHFLSSPGLASLLVSCKQGYRWETSKRREKGDHCDQLLSTLLIDVA